MGKLNSGTKDRFEKVCTIVAVGLMLLTIGCMIYAQHRFPVSPYKLLDQAVRQK